MDDGQPGTGKVVALVNLGAGNNSVGNPANYAAGDACVASATLYNTADSNAATTNACGLQFEFQ